MSTLSESVEQQDPAARARAIVEALRGGKATSEEVFAAFAELDDLPADVVRDALGAWTGPAPDPELLDDAMRRKHGFSPRRLHLRAVRHVRDADVLDLGPVVDAQIRAAGKSWDGLDLAPEERLDAEVEGAFEGSVEHVVVADATDPARKPVFDVLRFGQGAGVVFRAGSAEIVGMIADGVLEHRDRRVRVALQELLSAPFDIPVTAAPIETALVEEAAAQVIEEAEEAAVPSLDEDAIVTERVLPTDTQPDDEELVATTPKPKKTKKKAAAAPKKKRAAAAAPVEDDEEASAPKAKKAAAKKPAAKTKKKAAAKKAAAAPAPAKKTAATTKKKAASAKKTAAKKTAAAPAKKTTATKKKKAAVAPAKKTAAKKTAAAPAKKTAATKKKAAAAPAKKTAAKKTAAGPAKKKKKAAAKK